MRLADVRRAFRQAGAGGGSADASRAKSGFRPRAARLAVAGGPPRALARPRTQPSPPLPSLDTLLPLLPLQLTLGRTSSHGREYHAHLKLTHLHLREAARLSLLRWRPSRGQPAGRRPAGPQPLPAPLAIPADGCLSSDASRPTPSNCTSCSSRRRRRTRPSSSRSVAAALTGPFGAAS